MGALLCVHEWPDELVPEAPCRVCGLAYGAWMAVAAERVRSASRVLVALDGGSTGEARADAWLTGYRAGLRQVAA